MVNHQFLNDFSNGDKTVYRIKAREMKSRYIQLFEQLKYGDYSMDEYVEIIHNIIDEVYDVLLYGSNDAFLIAYQNIEYINENKRFSITLMQLLLEFDIDYYLFNDDKW